MKLKDNKVIPRVFITILVILVSAFPSFVKAQTDVSDNSTPSNMEKINKWNITLNGGATLFWGDLSDEVANPFSKYFTDQQGLGYGLILSRRIGNAFTANLQYIGGGLQGYRTTWSNGDTTDLSFKSSINEVNLNVEVDLMNLFFESKEHRLFSAYLKGGVGYLFYKPVVTHTSDGSPVYSKSGSSLVIPWGWGVKSDISKHLTIRFENTFHHAMKDDVDGHGTEYSNVNDIYNYTSLGVTYRIYQKPKQPKMPKEEEIVPMDTAVAAVEPEETPFELSIAANFPSDMHPYDTSDVTLRISKGDIGGAAKLQQTIPEGFIVKELLSSGAQFDFKNQIMTYSWDELPEKETLDITYRLISKDASMGTNSIPGILFYIQNDVDQIRQFKKNVEIVAEPVIAKTNPITSESNNPTQTNENNATPNPANNASTEGKSLVYRVQVYAVYGGTTSSRLLEKRLNLDYPVQQDYQGDYAKYTSGEFATYEEAAAYKKKLRGTSVPGAFVVGFYEGSRTKDIQEAITIENGGKAIDSKASVPMGLIYRVQILASARNLSLGQVKEQTGCSDSFEKVTHNGLYKYEVGKYKSYSEAKVALERIRNEVSDAFIVKYKDGKRI